MEKFKTLFKNDSFEIVQVSRKCRNEKRVTSYYVDFGFRDCGAGSQICYVEYDSKADLKEFIKES